LAEKKHKLKGVCFGGICIMGCCAMA